MPIVTVITEIHAPIDVCFDLARSIELHTRSTLGTDEKAIAGITSGVIGPGEEVTWEARHFGIRHRLTSRISAFDKPRYFRDSQVRGPFARFDHDHVFSCESGITVMEDIFDYESPMGWVGRVVDGSILKRYMQRFLAERGRVIRAAAESGVR